MICNTCGEKVREGAVVCPNCGFKPTDKKHVVKTVNEDKDDNKDKKETRKAAVSEMKDGALSVLWGILGYFIPIVGLVLFIVWKETKPKDSKAAGLGALIRVIVAVVGLILVFIFTGTFKLLSD